MLSVELLLANCYVRMGSTVPVGVTIFGRVNLSPKLFGPQHQWLRTILTHELSHAHIQGWIGG